MLYVEIYYKMDQMQNFDKVVQDAEIRKLFPPLEEQMEVLAPELQVELYNMEEIYDNEIKMAGIIRQNIIDTEHNLHDANITCSTMVINAVNKRRKRIKELRDTWGKFFYNTSK